MQTQPLAFGETKNKLLLMMIIKYLG